MALVLAMFYGESRRSARSMTEILIGGALLAVPVWLILAQPDLGTAATLVPVYLGVIYVAGMRMRWLAIAAGAALLLSPVVWQFGLQDYQKERVETFLNPRERSAEAPATSRSRPR